MRMLLRMMCCSLLHDLLHPPAAVTYGCDVCRGRRLTWRVIGEWSGLKKMLCRDAPRPQGVLARHLPACVVSPGPQEASCGMAAVRGQHDLHPGKELLELRL